MEPTETTAPRDRENTLLVVAIALVSLPAIFLGWVWIVRAGGDPVQGLVASALHARNDPLVLAVAVDFLLLIATIAVWIWRDGRARGLGRGARGAWVLALACLGALGLWMYLAVRPPRRREGCASSE